MRPRSSRFGRRRGRVPAASIIISAAKKRSRYALSGRGSVVPRGDAGRSRAAKHARGGVRRGSRPICQGRWPIRVDAVSHARWHGRLSGETAERVTEANLTFFRSVHAWPAPFIERGEMARLPVETYVPVILGPAAFFSRHWLAGRMTLDINEAAATLATAAWTASSRRPVRGARETSQDNSGARKTSLYSPHSTARSQVPCHRDENSLASGRRGGDRNVVGHGRRDRRRHTRTRPAARRGRCGRASAADSFEFETEAMEGTIRLDGAYHGVTRLIDKRTGGQVIDARYSALNLFKLNR